MHRYRHHPRQIDGFFVEHVELVPDHLAEYFARGALAGDGRHIVQLERVRHGQKRTALDAHLHRQFVVRIVRHVLDAGFREQIGRVKALGEAHAQPTPRAFAGRFLDDVEIPPDELALLLHAHRGQNAGVVVALGTPLPVAFVALANDLRILAADVAVEVHCPAKSVPIHRLHDPPQPDAIAVIAPTVIEDVGTELQRPRIDRVRERSRSEGHMLDVHVDEHGQPLAAGKAVGLAIDDGLKIVSWRLRRHRIGSSHGPAPKTMNALCSPRTIA